MATYVPIIAALKSGLIKPENFVAYTPDEKRYMCTKGMLRSEIIETEFDLGWHAVEYKGFGVLLVADKATEASMIKSKEYGINIETLEEYANLYQNKSLQSIGVALTPALFREIPRRLIQDNIWFASSDDNSFHRMIRHNRRPNRMPTYSIHHMQPTLFIPPDTIVEIDETVGKSKENGYKLYPRNSININQISKDSLAFASMPMWVPLSEAVFTRAIFSTDFVEYIPDKTSVKFSAEETNSKEQTAETEYDMGGWHPIVLKKNDVYMPYLVATHCSKFELEIWPDKNDSQKSYCLGILGKNQFDIGIKLLERYAKIFSSKELNAQAIPFNEKIFDNLDWNLISEGDTYFLANTFTKDFHIVSIFGEVSEEYEQRMGLKWIARGVYGYKQCGDPMLRLSIRIAVPLPENVMVQINNPLYDGSTEEKALKLKLAEKEDNSK